MGRLVPLNSATCPHCRQKKAMRVGYAEKQHGSLWQCTNEDCKKVFLIPTMALTRAPAKKSG